MGLAQDWNVTKKEAKQTLDLWYQDRYGHCCFWFAWLERKGKGFMGRVCARGCRDGLCCRPEVREWQQRVIARAERVGYTTTLLGRHRNLNDINSTSPRLRGRAQRAAINTPIQVRSLVSDIARYKSCFSVVKTRVALQMWSCRPCCSWRGMSACIDLVGDCCCKFTTRLFWRGPRGVLKRLLQSQR